VSTQTRTRPETRTEPFTSAPAERPARSFIAGSIGTKILIGATGLLLIVYLVIHLAGNVLIYFGPATFNGYAHFMLRNPLIIPIEIGLLAIFVLHVYKVATNWLANRRARPVGYVKRRWGGPGSRKSIASSTMILTGLVLFVFVPIHLVQFKYGPEHVVQEATPTVEAAAQMRDLYGLVVQVFGNALNVGFYVFCMVVVGFHLWHGFSSAFQSLGADHPRTTPWVLRAGQVVAIAIAGGFITIPLWIYFGGGRP
jgi:succinate dehydrogenase / fumarate reductase cytochrome b subunit